MNHANEVFLLHILAQFLSVSGCLGVALGLILIIKPAYFERLNLVANHWISFRCLSSFFDRSVKVEQFFYRNHRVMGLLITLSACYIFIYFGALLDKSHSLLALADTLPPPFLEIALDTFVLTLLVGGAMGLVVGVFLWLRPSLLRGLEDQSNQWISTRQSMRFLDVSHDGVNAYVSCHLRRVGWGLFLASLYLEFLLFHWFS